MKTKEECRKEAVKILYPLGLISGVLFILMLFTPVLFIWTNPETVYKIIITFIIMQFILFIIFKLLKKTLIKASDKLYEEELLTNPEGKSKFQQKMDKMLEEDKSKQR